MKTFSTLSFLALALSSASAPANDILIYKFTRLTNYTLHSADDPDGASPMGLPAISGKDTETGYAVVDLSVSREPGSAPGVVHLFSLETDDEAVPAYDVNANPVNSRKVFSLNPLPDPLSNTFQKLQPLKSGASLWNSQEGFAIGKEGSLSRYESYCGSEQLTGVTAPLALSKTLVIPNVPRTLTGTGVDFGYGYTPAGGGDPPFALAFSETISSTWTLDTALTKAANTLPVSGTPDLDTLSPETSYSGTLAAGTLVNGVQRVRNLIYATGYRLAKDP